MSSDLSTQPELANRMSRQTMQSIKMWWEEHLIPLKSEAKITTEDISQRSDLRLEIKAKADPKPKETAPCTSVQKKAGKCPAQQNYKNWEVLNPTKGCRPKSCSKCGKATITKGSKTNGKNAIRDLLSLDSPTLSKRAATVAPASTTVNGLNAWTKTVWASSPKDLPLGVLQRPTSFFFEWSKLNQGISFVTVKGLFGSSGRRSSFKLTDLTDAQKKNILAYQSEADVKSAVDDVFPTTGFESLTKFKTSFTAASKVQSMVAVWDGITGGNDGDQFKITGPHMRKIVDDLLPGTATKLVEYKSTANAANDAADVENYHGKISVSYDSGTKKYQVWMPAAQSGAPILKN
ncbi:hypothetical protein E8E13_001403 [Curvularia kusanoi]|uniref:Uncharacterized protein n=1 Tax=Curvularia kusanoi TaxID=90978 RepID=A0A9P4T434_CURKU|nr:hypothetical protein E8E13_001403 [Curvularia kusanoi]